MQTSIKHGAENEAIRFLLQSGTASYIGHRTFDIAEGVQDYASAYMGNNAVNRSKEKGSLVGRFSRAVLSCCSQDFQNGVNDCATECSNAYNYITGSWLLNNAPVRALGSVVSFGTRTLLEDVVPVYMVLRMKGEQVTFNDEAWHALIAGGALKGSNWVGSRFGMQLPQSLEGPAKYVLGAVCRAGHALSKK